MKWFAVLIVCTAAWAHAAVHIDDAGRSVDFAAPPRRVVTLAPSLTEFVYAVGAGSTMVGTVDTSNHPQAAQRVPRIGDYQRLDVERIISLKPDVVLVWHHGNQGRELAQLEEAGLRLFYLEPRRIADVPRTLSRVGALLGHEAHGNARTQELRRELAALRARYADVSPVSVFFQVWSRPLMTLSGDHLTSDVIALCGGRNIFASLPALASQIAVESVVAADPEVMLTAATSASNGAVRHRDATHGAFAMWRPFSRLTAVKRGWMFTVHGDLVTRQGPRVVQGVRAVCAALDEVRAERGVR